MLPLELYDKLYCLQVDNPDVPYIIEEDDMYAYGVFMHGTIYINANLHIHDKLKVLLRELGNYVYLEYFSDLGINRNKDDNIADMIAYYVSCRFDMDLVLYTIYEIKLLSSANNDIIEVVRNASQYITNWID